MAYDPTTDPANYGEEGQYLKGPLMKYVATNEMMNKSWWPSYQKAVQESGGDPNKIVAWAQYVAPQFSDFDGATDGEFVGRNVSRAQSLRAIDKTQQGVNAGIGLGGLAIGAGAAGLFGGAGAAGAGASAGTSSAIEGGLATGGSLYGGGMGDIAIAGGEGVNALGGTGEPGMWDWLDGMDTGGGFDPGGNLYSPPNETGAFDMDASKGVFDSNGNPIYKSPFDLGGMLKQYGAQGLSALKGLYSAGAGGTSASKGGSALSSFLGNPAETAFNSAPFLLALAESNRQSGDLNGVIDKINGQGYTQAVLNPYDMDTGMGKTNMLQDLSLRGVSGSSFGNQQLGNYDYMRALGRGDLASKAQLSAAGLEGSLINTKNTNRNMLLGAGLNASAKLFSPQSDPFGLQFLRGLTP